MTFEDKPQSEIEISFLLPNGTVIGKTFYQEIRSHLLSRAQIMSNRPQQLKQLCAPEFWERLNRHSRTTAGKAVVHMVEVGELPLIRAPQVHEYPCRYIRN